ncbi:hypothetical protein KAFR_0G01260 [Kazachstania africana CBS 2517]|uniref:Phosphotransferase n=1 Tax=Kazachstania africana (strain ATCC 22294 / BCRC 22015 / CBS 2517 / CECT 1963 / NBRC 1671 / NRRL Y-8276) TaxID=1071382 RepID=H2AXR0_KAZAF|nr:hypothetical protein KAFR_0G01260 [Kazachstania africana CBS 2517]CCF59160.1 hypothetical protein KAFR_0G01260 [Kazachstania africana CBS 2517]
MSFDKLHKEAEGVLLEEAGRISKQFEITSEKLHELTHYFIDQMDVGLNAAATREERGLPMCPSYVTGTPNGTETGTFLAAELGGTNFRVYSVKLNGDHTYEIEQLKSKIPEELLDEPTLSSADLFSYMARRTKVFMHKYHPEVFEKGYGKSLKLGFTFSYPVDQNSLNSGTLLRWTKGFNIKDAVGSDVVQLYQDQLDDLGLDMINIVALTNDTIGTFLSLCYSSGSPESIKKGEISQPVIGAIFGTGTNGCYMEKVTNIGKLSEETREKLINEGKEEMCINTEWGSFDNDLKYLPTTKYDIDIDQKFSNNPGYHLFEKRVAGMFLGEILRNVLVDLHDRHLILNQFRTHDQLPHRLKTPFELSSDVMARIEIDDSSTLRETELSFLQRLRLPTTFSERKAIQMIVRAISRRSAYLAAVPMAAILIKTGVLNKRYHGEVEIGCHGAIFEFYPGFRTMLREGLALTPIGSDGERKIHLRLTKNSSGVGSALCALVA